MTHYRTSLPQPARIVDLIDESPRVRTLLLDLHLEADPGQFVMAWLPGLDEKPLSLVCADPVTLTVARVGPFTTAVCALEVGNAIWIRGPLGQGFALAEPQGALLLLGGGYGVAPIYFLAERALARGWEVSMVIGSQTSAEVLFTDRFGSLDAQVVVATDDGSLGQQGLATDAAERLLEQADYQALYACGPEPMLEAVASLAESHHLPAQLSYERYMRCGFGVCGSCAQEGWLVCRDGPVKVIGRRVQHVAHG
jgi:dihydroorotate dehydrogenase electron transfer subunit